VVVVLVFLVLPLAELAVFVAGAHAFGLPATFAALVLFSVAGAVLVKHRGLLMWRRVNDELGAGRVPTAELLDGAWVLAGGALLVIPGFITDALGILLLLPPVRAVLRPLALRAMIRRAERSSVIVLGSSGTGGPIPGADWFTPATGGFLRGDVVDTSGSERVADARVVGLDVDEPRALGPGR
jgi:UPF0716 protein FxsA